MAKELVVIGDVHGYAAKLEDLLEQVRELWPKAKVCLAGDYFDRGPENLRTYKVLKAFKVDCVMGNHDMFLYEWLLGKGNSIWFHHSNGGHKTWEEICHLPHMREELTKWLAGMPFQRTYPEVLVDGKPVVVTHAPQVRADFGNMTKTDLWHPCHRRSAYKRHHGVCGHMMHPYPILTPHVSYVDTGAALGGPLTAVHFPSKARVSVGGWGGKEDELKALMKHNKASGFLNAYLDFPEDES